MMLMSEPYIRGGSCSYCMIQITQRGGVGENAGAAVSDQQVKPQTPRYPVDRYLVERSKKFEIVNILDDDIWKVEPALRPEDEIILGKLQDKLQSTADDLKLLSGELSKYHEPGVQVKSLPTPLDEDFNEKVHIEEIVNAKFHGYKVVGNSPQPTPASTQRNVIEGLIKTINTNVIKPKKDVSTGIQVNKVPILKKPTTKNNLAISKTKVIEINENIVNKPIAHKKNNTQENEKNKPAAVAYNEFSFKYEKPKIHQSFRKPLEVQNMPSINIRSELKEQKVLNINIEPDPNQDKKLTYKSNVSVISLQHEPTTVRKRVPNTSHNEVQFSIVPTATTSKEPIRRVSKMTSCDSSESTNNHTPYHKEPHKVIKTNVRKFSKQMYENEQQNKHVNTKRENAKHRSLDEWKRKLNTVYGRPISSRKIKLIKNKPVFNQPENKAKNRKPIESMNKLNNAEYIPYSKLTIGGVKVSDIEKELTDIPNRNDIPLSPILDKILSRENSFQNENSQDDVNEDSPKILTTSDENLLREVLDIEGKVSETILKNNTDQSDMKDQISNNVNDLDSYADDFEDENSVNSDQKGSQDRSLDSHSEDIKSDRISDDKEPIVCSKDARNYKTKKINLSFKNTVDIFEFVHCVDTQDTGTQSNSTQKISLKETQTSPRNDRRNVQPIHNDLWPSLDTKGEVEKLFEIEKDFIKKIIIDEYGDLLTKNLNKPSTSKGHETSDEKNYVASQKITQTSPARVKNVMTSPTRTKTRTTSPLAVSLTVDKQTSPIIVEEFKINVEDDDLDISINLSSPRFNLRLPQTSNEVISNTESHKQANKYNNRSNKTELQNKASTTRKQAVSSSSSIDGDYSSSDISSLGEVRLKFKNKLRNLCVPSISELSSSTSQSQYSSDTSDAIIPLRSEGEVSLGQINNRRKSNKNKISDGELSLKQLYR